MRTFYVRTRNGGVLTPPQVLNVVGTPIGSSEIDLTWTPITGSSNYVVRRNGTPIANPPPPVFNDTGLTANTTYTYVVTAVNAYGEGVPSAPTNVTTGNPPATTWKRAFGHGLCLGFGKSTLSQVKALIDAVRASKATFVQVDFYPGKYDIGTTTPNYGNISDAAGATDSTKGRGFVKALLDYAWNNGVNPVYVALGMEDRTFDAALISSVPSNIYPPWWYVNSSFSQGFDGAGCSQGWIIVNMTKSSGANVPKWGAAGTITALGSPQTVAMVHTTNVLNAWTNIWIDVLQNFDTHPALIWICPSGESAISTGLNSTQLQTYWGNCLKVYQSLTNFTTQTPMRWQFNNVSPPQPTPNLAAMVLIPGMLIGSPDPEGQNTPPDPPPLNINRAIQGWDNFRGQSSPTVGGFGPDFRDVMGFVAEFQTFDNPKNPSLTRTPSPKALWDVSQQIPQKNQYWVWGLASGNANFSQLNVLAFINSINGATHNVVPSSWT